MKIRKILAAAMAACLVAGSLAGCGKKADDKVIKIGVFEPTTGENGGGGFQEVLGIRYANQMHPTVTIGGEEYKVELVEVDNKSDKTEAVNAAQKLVSEKVSVVLEATAPACPSLPDRSLQMPSSRLSAAPAPTPR